MIEKSIDKNIKIVNVFGIDVFFPNYSEYFYFLSECLKQKKQITVNYCNANTIRLTKSNKRLLLILNSLSFVHADGTGIYFAAKWLGKQKIERFNWTDFAEIFLSECSQNNWSIFFLGSDSITIAKMKNKLKINYPSLNIAGILNGYDDVNDKTAEIINKTSPDILWVGLGTPKQELWIYENFSNLNATIIQSVGGLFDFLAGSRFRGPEFIRKFGLEWLVRVLQYPTKYFDRYILGIPIFFYLLIKEKIKNLFMKLT